ncbi:MAG: hypothetical protein RLZZ416_370 [Candidatus Parcubacteria bacterium]
MFGDVPLGQRIFDRIIRQLCERQAALSHRIILVDPAKCGPLPAPTLTLRKSVVNDDGGTAVASDFQAKIDGSNVPWGVAQAVSVGPHTASETSLPGYSASSWGSDCASDGTVALSPGENKTCSITNDDNPPSPTTGHLIVDKVTDPSGSAAAFSIEATGTAAIIGSGAASVTDATSKNYEVEPGTFSVSESPSTGWIEMSNTCSNISVAAGETKTCTITNAKLPTLTVTKIVVNDNGGTATTSDFSLMIDGMTTASSVASTTTIGAHSISEGAHTGYTSTIGGDCAADGSITLVAGDNKTCTVTNDDNPPQQSIGHMVISEIYYDVASTTTTSPNDAPFEWVELYNGSNSAVDLHNWLIGDASSTDPIANSVVVQPGQRALIVASSTPIGIPAGVPVIVLHSSIGQNGFSNSEDAARLFDSTPAIVDQVGYGTDTSVSPNVPLPASHDGHSLVRVQLTSDTDTAADWADTATPTPGS